MQAIPITTEILCRAPRTFKGWCAMRAHALSLFLGMEMDVRLHPDKSAMLGQLFQPRPTTDGRTNGPVVH